MKRPPFFPRFSLLLALAVIIFSASFVHADVSLPALFSDDMVLQRDQVNPVWGWADPGEEVTVALAEQSKTTRADERGNWSLELSPMAAGGPYTLKVEGKNALTLENVLFGEVWICSGQSNMRWTVANSKNAEQEIAAAEYPNIRLFAVPMVSVPEPKKDVEAIWTPCNPETVAPFSAVAYYFGRELHKELDVPLGLIRTCWGGSTCEAWIEKKVLHADDDYQAILDRVEKAGPQHKAYHLYNGMIAPLIPYGIRGAIWYQGESNANRAYQYRKLFPTMIRNWRANWGEGDFPFYFVQLANFRERQEKPGDSAWAELREAQSMTLSLPNTGQAVTIDIGEADDIHPKNKQDVGRRLARWALAKDYGKDITYSGPDYRAMKREGEKIALQFDHVDGGLVAKGDSLKGFTIAGENQEFVQADAKIEGETVVVSSPKVAQPVAVRYAWADNPEANLYNEAGLPASPFRTDTWPGITVTNQ